MKKLLLIALLMYSPIKLQASGCLGGEWQEKENSNSLGIIQADYYGSKTEIAIDQEGGWLILKEVSAQGTHLDFYGDSFPANSTDIVSLVKQLQTLPKALTVGINKVVSVNSYYDDCEDIPENTTRTENTYKFPIQLESGKDLYFSATTITYDPPLKDKI
jgi:hypothetical protein